MLRVLVLCFVGAHAVRATEGTPTTESEPADYLVARWETVDGLPENSATAVAQTPDGYLWIGTFNGLARFNGATFTVFDPDNTPALPSAGIVGLHADGGGRLWISTYDGLVVREGLEWRRWGPADGWNGGVVRTFVERPNGDLLLTTFDGRLVEFTAGRFFDLPPPPGETGQGYFGGIDEAGYWWAVQNQFIGRWEHGRWVQRMVPPETGRDVIGCAPARDGGIWLLTGRQLRKMRQGVEALRIELSEVPGGVWSVFEDSNGHVWIATYNDGFCRVTLDGAVARWSGSARWSDNGRCVFEDHEGNLWLGTSGDGLMRLTARRFRVFELIEGRRGAVVQSVAVHPAGGVWAATYGHGLFHVDAHITTPFRLPGLAADTPYLQSVLAEPTGRLWVGTMGAGLRLVQEGATRTIPPEQAAGGNMIALFNDSRNRVWASGGGSAVARFNGETAEILGPSAGVPAGPIVGFAEDTAGAIWISNGAGVFRREQEHLFVEVKDSRDRPIAGVACLFADADGSMWLSSSDRGLLRWKSGRLVEPRMDVPFVGVQSMIEDLDGFLWLTSGHQVVRVHRSELHAVADGRTTRIRRQLFDTSDGLPRADFTSGRQPMCVRDPEGRLWFATIKGVAMIDPRRLRLNPEPPHVHIESISYYGRAVSAETESGQSVCAAEIQTQLDGPFGGQVSLPPGSRRIGIAYAALSYAAPDRVQYLVKLEGQDREWHNTGHRRVAEFHDLSPGRYVFQVRAANHDGVWNETGESLAFTVLPYFWQTGWFRLGVGLFLISLGAAAAWRQSLTRIRRALEHERTAHEIRNLAGRLINAQEEERRRIARELHDDFSQRLALLSVEMELADASAASAANSTPRLAEMAAQVKELSTEVHRMAYELHPAKLDQLGLVAAGRSFCRELSRQSGVRIVFEPGEFPRDVRPELALCLYRILQESLHNMVNHSGAAEARVELRAEPNRLCLVVSDDGKGFDVDRARLDGGLGLLSMSERVRLVRGSLKVDSRPGRGTRVEVCAPSI